MSETKRRFPDRLFDLIADAGNHGISQNEIAEEMGVPSSSLSNYKSQNSIPRADVLVKIADYFDVSVDWLLGRSEYKRIDGHALTVKKLGLSESTVQVLIKKHSREKQAINSLLPEESFRGLLNALSDLEAAMEADKVVQSLRDAFEDWGEDIEDNSAFFDLLEETRTKYQKTKPKVAAFLYALEQRFSRFEGGSVFNNSEIGETFIQGLSLQGFYEIQVSKKYAEFISQLSKRSPDITFEYRNDENENEGVCPIEKGNSAVKRVGRNRNP